MSRIRIVCKAPHTERPADGLSPLVDFLPCWADVEISVLDDAGNVHALRDVTSIEWHCRQGNEPAYAVLRVDNIEVDVEAAVRR